MSFKDYFKNEKLSLKQLYGKLKTVKPQNDFRDKVLEATGMAETTFWQKMKGDRSFTDEEKQQIANVTGRPLKQLFPC